MSSKKPEEQSRAKSPESADKTDKTKHADPAAPPPKDLDPSPESQGHTIDWPEELNQGAVHPGPLEPPQAKARLHMDQIDAVATPQGVVLFALTEGGEIWQLTSFAGHQEWTHILTPEAPAEDV